MKLLGLLLFALSLFGQQDLTRFYHITSNFTGVGPLGIPPGGNIGQAQHIVTVMYKNAGGVCNNPTLAPIQVQASRDGVNYFNISRATSTVTPLSGTTAPYVGTVYAFGAYPLIRIYVSQSITFCSVDIDYSGIVQTGAFPPLANTDIGGFQTTFVAPATATDSLIVGPLAGVFGYIGGRVVIYGLIVYNSGGVNNVTISERVGTCSGTTANILLNLPAMPQYDKVILPTSNTPWLTANPANLICATLSAATAVNITAIYRIE